MQFIGIDPDVSCLTIATVDRDGLLMQMQAFKSKQTGIMAIKDIIQQVALTVKVPSDVRAIAIEGQEIVYTALHGYNPRSLLPLAHMAGAMHGVCASACPATPIFIPPPAKWKGQVPKDIHQARILKRLGVKYRKMGGKSPYCVPECADRFDLNPGDWKHAMDSWGLAVWAREQYKKDHQYEF